MEPQDAPVIVNVEAAAKQYVLGKTRVEALRGVDLTIGKGELLAIAGPSGSGKTTLLNLIGAIERPTAGRICIEGTWLDGLSSDTLAMLRRRTVGFVFQRFNLLPVLTALENVEYPLVMADRPAPEARQRAQRALEEVGLLGLGRHRPLELSGGQQQRVAIARAIVTDPHLILADEPTANLDHATGASILELMRHLNHQRGTTVVFSTHDTKVMELATRIVRLEDGRISVSG